MSSPAGTQAAPAAGGALLPLALAQFICSFAGSNMNVMLNDMSRDLDTTVQGIQVSITLFLLVMAALMIPFGKLTDLFGRKFCFILGLAVYGVGAIVSALSPGLGVLILGNSILEGAGTALLIPPVYILVTMYWTGTAARVRAFGVVSAAGGVGAATGPLIGGWITAAISWRAAFIFQALIIVIILILSIRLKDPRAADRGRPYDLVGAILSGLGLIVFVLGILAADTHLLLSLGLMLAGAGVIALFFVWVRRLERAGREPLLSTALFRNRVSNLGLVTQNFQWLLLMGTSMLVASQLQVVRQYDAIETGVIFSAATVGILVSSLSASALVQRFTQRSMVVVGFVITGVGLLLLLLVAAVPGAWAYAPGLLAIGLGLGLTLTPSVNVVQSAFPEEQQGEISGLSRSVSNLGSSFGTAIVATVLALNASGPGEGYGLAMVPLLVVAVAGVVVAAFLPGRGAVPAATEASASQR
ncbi:MULTISPECIES: MFS transporter [unclassified Microbacterium]|uniref:MFS transporter n=1 Tax=unclassified Microbacterium TaxID=2609290 RepID=UPI00214B4128|nr:MULTISPECIES: MFS transporter [unclassified Microbacterium]MCR2784176.1 MFS transporter [Microbacterium sp. zg.B96]WIM14990.1 MFS transporter [Microbacterium sp. zg-B96]